jgi:hypothetical protein
MSVLSFVLAAANILAPGRDHSELGTAIAAALDESAPFFADDADRTKSAALAVAIAFRESSLNNDAIGDHGRSHCAFQIHLPGKSKTAEGWTGEDLRADVNRCVSVAFRMLRESIHVDRQHPVAFYARGPRRKTEEARRISRDRVALARRIHAVATAALAAESST